MARSFLRSAASILFAAALVAGAATASAQGDRVSDEDRASARLLAADGVQMAAGGDCAGAVDRLSRAESIVHAAATAVPLAQCEIQLGKIIAGTELLIRVVNEPLPPNPPPGAIEAKKRAQTALDAAQPRIAKLRIHVDRPSADATGLEVTVDAQAVPAVLVDGDLPVDPGTHHVAARQPGLAPAEADVTVADGEARALVLRLDPLPPAVPPASPAPGVAPGEGSGATPPAMEGPANSSRSTTAFVLYTAAGAGLFLGAGFGVAALVTKSNLDAECAGTLCPASAQSDIGALHTDAILSTVGFGIAAAGVLAGTVVLLGARDVHAPSTSITLHPWLGPGSMGVAGIFR
ncbi:MAG TPA: hypothetical protein VGM06_07860 [Polyangiaceae bacterium]|jgi:hypothetical protein